jgi:hypothetical protein
MLPIAALLAAAVLAPAAPAGGSPFPPRIPFPPPKVAQYSDAMKCDWGTVLSVDRGHGRMQGMTKAGPVTYLVGPEVPVVGKDGKTAGGITVLEAGQKYRTYYLVDNGAKVLEIDLLD